MASTAGEETSVERDENALDNPTPSTKLTPGQRLAQRKAAKAKRKAELKGTADSAVDEVAEEVEKVAEEFTDFWTENQSRILLGIGAFLVVAVGVLLWSKQADSGAAAEANALYTAVQAATAEVDADGATEGDDDTEPVFASVQDRAKAAATTFGALAQQYPGSAAARLGRLGTGAAQMDLGDYEAARTAFEDAEKQLSGSPMLHARALEGAAIALEAANKLDEALGKLQALAELDDGAFRDVADYRTARIKLAKGDREGAKQLLKGAYDRLGAPEPGEPARSFLRNQVELVLMELDSSLVDKASAGGMPGGGMTQEQLQELIRQLQQKQGAP